MMMQLLLLLLLLEQGGRTTEQQAVLHGCQKPRSAGLCTLMDDLPVL
jgi:hypothetical protein